MLMPPPELGSGKLGTPWARMHRAKRIPGSRLAAVVPGLPEDPQAPIRRLHAITMSALRGMGCSPRDSGTLALYGTPHNMAVTLCHADAAELIEHQKSPARRAAFSLVADTGPVAALGLSLSGRPKQKTEGAPGARCDRSFVDGQASCFPLCVGYFGFGTTKLNRPTSMEWSWIGASHISVSWPGAPSGW